MNCNQCQEAAKGIGCTVFGVCGKTPQLSALMDTFIYSLIGLSSLALEAKKINYSTEELDLFVMEGLFATITNANFDEDEFVARILKSIDYRETYKNLLQKEGVALENISAYQLELTTKEEMIQKAFQLAIHQTEDEDIRSIRELMLFGLKGLAAYLSHAEKLNYKNEDLFKAMHEFMASLINDSLTLEEYVPMTLALGEVGVQAMALLDEANTNIWKSRDFYC